MSWIWREKPDGTRGFGFAVYLAVGAALFCLVAVLRHQGAKTVAAAIHPSRGRGADVAAVTTAAATLTPVPVRTAPEPLAAKSFRMKRGAKAKRGRAAAPAESSPVFDAVAAVLARKPDVPTGGFAALVPAFPQDANGGPEGGQGSGPAAAERGLFGYRDGAADGTGVEGSAGAAEGPRLPRAMVIPVTLMTTVDSSHPAALIEFAVSEEVLFAGERAIPFGTRLLGKLGEAPVRDRAVLDADALLFPDGFELPCAAAAVEVAGGGTDIRPGICGEYHPPPTWAQAAPYFAEFFSGMMGLLQSRAQPQLTVGLTGISLEPSASQEVRGSAYEASASAVQDYARARLKEVEQRYAAYLLIPAGTELGLQLTRDLDLAPLRKHEAEPRDPRQ
jgi:hypothetical protein